MPEKKVDLLPIIGWDIGADPSGSIGLMTIRSLPGLPRPEATQAQIDKATEYRQYGMYAEQCEELSRNLLELAARLRAAKAALS